LKHGDLTAVVDCCGEHNQRPINMSQRYRSLPRADLERSVTAPGLGIKQLVFLALFGFLGANQDAIATAARMKHRGGQCCHVRRRRCWLDSGKGFVVAQGVLFEASLIE